MFRKSSDAGQEYKVYRPWQKLYFKKRSSYPSFKCIHPKFKSRYHRIWLKIKSIHNISIKTYSIHSFFRRGGWADNGHRFLASLRLVVDSLTAGASPFLHHHSSCRTVCHTICAPFSGFALFSQIVSLEYGHIWRHPEYRVHTGQLFDSVWLETTSQVMLNFLPSLIFVPALCLLTNKIVFYQKTRFDF